MSDSSDSDDSRGFASPEELTPRSAPFTPDHSPSRPSLPLSAAAAALQPPPPGPEILPTPITLNSPDPPPSIAADPVSSDARSKAKTAFDSLAGILPVPLPSSLSSSPNPAVALLYDPSASAAISSLIRRPDAGAGDNPLCRWLYDTFQSSDPFLQLLVLRFAPLLSGVYLRRAATRRRHLAGFEAVLLAFYSHETTARSSDPPTITLPDLSSPSAYQTTPLPSPSPSASASAASDPIEVSPTLEPHRTVRSTRRGAIVGAALELYHKKIALMPLASKLEFCQFCEGWAGQVDESDTAEARIPLPWELMQPALRILGHCIMGPNRADVLHGIARRTCMKLYARSLRDVNPKAILAIESLLRMMKIEEEDKLDYTELPRNRVISI